LAEPVAEEFVQFVQWDPQQQQQQRRQMIVSKHCKLPAAAAAVTDMDIDDVEGASADVVERKVLQKK
jgi:hypothetical protein